ncbi:MAG: hypothetical protein H0T92_25215 [Pyrinomonadaceae bacterium]|nr:hypothetical protein [Pyrinomonadaceae bacterium]
MAETGVCRECGSVFSAAADESRRCELCHSYSAGRMVLAEGQRFYVTAAKTNDLRRWLDGEWIASRIIETHPTFADARAAVASCNRRAPEGTYFFITSNLTLTG